MCAAAICWLLPCTSTNHHDIVESQSNTESTSAFVQEDDTEVSSKRGKTKTPEHPHAPPPALATAGGNKGPNTVSVAGPSMSDKSVDAAGQAGLRIAAPAVPPNTATGPATPQQLPARHAPRVFWQVSCPA